MQLPKVEMPEEQRKALKDRVEAFRKAVNAGTPIEPLVLTSDDLNVLISENEDLKGSIYVTVEGDEVKGKVSFPLDKLNVGMVRGRYLNGEADLKASLKDGVLIVTLDSIEVNGKKPPEEFLQGMRQQNLAKDAYKDQETANMMRKLESLEIKDGKIILKVRAKPGDSKTEADSKKDSEEVPVKVVPPSGRRAAPKNGAPSTQRPSPKSSRRHPSRPLPRRNLESRGSSICLTINSRDLE